MPPAVKKPTTLYRGSNKHKDRPTGDQKGTLCPEWTHSGTDGGYATDPYAYDWSASNAATLFAEAVVDSSSGRRYATARGIAFEAKPTKDGTWHGYPIPWESVPNHIKDDWLGANVVARRDIKRFLSFDKNDIYWAMISDYK